MTLPKISPSSGSFFIEIMNGKRKGTRFQIVSQKVSIGRSKENDIVLSDPKISRKHATLYITPDGLQIVRVNAQRKITVGKQDVSNAILELPSIILIGRTKLKATMINQVQSSLPIPTSPHSLQKPSSQSLTESNALNNQMINFHSHIGQSQSKTKFYMIAGGVILALYFVLSGPKKDEEVKSLITLEEQERRISSIQEKSNLLYRARQQTGKNTDQYKEARALFIQGLRDYRERNYLRAMDYFNGALALFPQHVLSQRYLQQSKTKQDELVQMKLLEANRHYEHKQYKQAIASYGQILLLIKDKTNKVYREAEGRKQECEEIVKSYM